MSVILKAEAIRHSYGKRLVLDLGSLEVHAGETLCLLGPNGAGKSTLLRILNLVEEPGAGTVWFRGERVTTGSKAVRRRMAGVFQSPHMFRGSVADNIAYGLKLRRTGRSERSRRVAEALEVLGITHLAANNARRLSGGEAQRVALARAIVLRPEVIFLDEPAGNLDPHARAAFHEDLRRIVRELNTTAVYVTHSLEEARAEADRIAVLRDGRLVQAAPAREVLERPADDFVARFLGVRQPPPARVLPLRGRINRS